MYVKDELVPKAVQRRRRRKTALIISGIATLGMIILAIIAFSLVRVDAFTVTTDNDPQLCLTLDEEKQFSTTKLVAPPIYEVSDTQYSEIPYNIEEGIGSKNTDSYFAYSFYLGGQSTATRINYSLSMTLDQASNEIDDAVRVMTIRNGVKTVYSKPDENGNGRPIYGGERGKTPETVLGTTKPFYENRHIILEPYTVIPGEYDKYTVVMWIDGWESVDTMKGGMFLATLKFSTISTIVEGEN